MDSQPPQPPQHLRYVFAPVVPNSSVHPGRGLGAQRRVGVAAAAPGAAAALRARPVRTQRDGGGLGAGRSTQRVTVGTVAQPGWFEWTGKVRRIGPRPAGFGRWFSRRRCWKPSRAWWWTVRRVKSELVKAVP